MNDTNPPSNPAPPAPSGATAPTPSPHPDIAPRVSAAPAPYVPPAASAPYSALIEKAAVDNNIPVSVLTELLNQESSFNPNAVHAGSGAKGIAQFMDATAAEWNVDVFNPASAIPAAARYLRWAVDFVGGDLVKGLAAYNWGVGNVKRQGLAAAPPETRNYVPAILARAGYTDVDQQSLAALTGATGA